jgi:hypothetical protein
MRENIESALVLSHAKQTGKSMDKSQAYYEEVSDKTKKMLSFLSTLENKYKVSSEKNPNVLQE